MQKSDVLKGVILTLFLFILVALPQSIFTYIMISLSQSPSRNQGYYDLLVAVIIWGCLCFILGLGVAKKIKSLILLSSLFMVVYCLYFITSAFAG
jgi:hypothetical protein